MKGARGGNIDIKFMYDSFPGVIPETDEFMFGTDTGVVKARTVRRLPEPDRWDGGRK